MTGLQRQIIGRARLPGSRYRTEIAEIDGTKVLVVPLYLLPSGWTDVPKVDWKVALASAPL